MSELVYERIKSNLLALNMKNTLEIIDNYLERAIADKINIVDVFFGLYISCRSRREERQSGREPDSNVGISVQKNA